MPLITVLGVIIPTWMSGIAPTIRFTRGGIRLHRTVLGRLVVVIVYSKLSFFVHFSIVDLPHC